MKVAITAISVASLPLENAFATNGPKGLVVAQTSLGGSEPLQPPPLAPPPATPIPSGPSSPRMDYIPPNSDPSAPGQPQDPSAEMSWGAIAFTADGSWSSAWKKPSRPEAEATVLRQCAAFGRGGCEVVSFSGQECVGLATFIGNYRRRRWLLSFTAGGMTYPQAQSAAMGRCNSDERSQGRCQLRTAACADGR